MGMQHSTYFAYGVHIPLVEGKYAWAEADHIETELPKIKEQCPDVGYLTAGDYDEDRLFLVTQCDDIELGDYKHVTPNIVTPEQLTAWNVQLLHAIAALDYGNRGVSPVGWICVPDLS